MISDSRDSRFDLVALFSAIVYVYSTSAVVSGRPSCHLALGLSLKVYADASGAASTVASSASMRVLSGDGCISDENTDAWYCASALVSARNGLMCASVAPHSGVSVPPAAGWRRAVVAAAAGAAVGAAAGAVVGWAAAGAVVGAAAGGVVGLGGAAVGAVGAAGAQAWSRAALPATTLRRSRERRDSMTSPTLQMVGSE